MKTKTFILAALAAACMIPTSCKKSVPMHQATVTVMGTGKNFYLKLDQNTNLKPENIAVNPFNRQVRAIVIFEDKGSISVYSDNKDWRSITVNAIDSILTKKPVASGSAKSTAPIELCRSWVNSFEDGYITLNFEGEWGDSGLPHILNLEKTDDPYTFILKHDCNGDVLRTHLVNGLVAFDLNGLVPESGSFDIKVAYEGYVREKTITFHVDNGVCTSPVASYSGE